MTAKESSKSTPFSVTATEGSTARTEAPTLTAGRALDVEVAVRVMGFAWQGNPRGNRSLHAPGGKQVGVKERGKAFVAFGSLHSTFLPHYSTDIAAAWTVVEHMREEGWFVLSTILNGTTGYFATRLQPSSFAASDIVEYVARGDSMPEAICLAALKSVSVLSQTEEGK